MSQKRLSSSSMPSSSRRKAPSSSDARPLSSREREAQISSLASTPPRRPRRRVRRPAPGSLHDLLRQNPRKALFIRPICWTDLHAKVLGVEFEELPPCLTPLPFEWSNPAPSHGHGRPSPTITTLGNALSEIFKPPAVHSILGSNAVKTTLMTLWPGAFSRTQYLPELNIFFGPKMYHDAVRVQAMWNFPTEESRSQSQGSTQSTCDTVSLHSLDSQTDSATDHQTNSSQSLLHKPTTTNLPMLCYIGKDRSFFIRNSMFRICHGPGKSPNLPVIRLQKLRAKMLVPEDPDQDAQYAGIFLAMAQQHFYNVQTPPTRRESFWWPLEKGPLPRPEFRDLKLRILTHDYETSEFLVYTGHITAKFLERFHYPFQNPESDDNNSDEGKGQAGMKIEYTRVPAWPIIGLRERLGKALGEDIVGPFDLTKMETWEEEEEEEDEAELEKQKQHKKRNRDALAQVLSGSFEKDSEGESPELGRKKRRLRQGRRVGVVV